MKFLELSKRTFEFKKYSRSVFRRVAISVRIFELALISTFSLSDSLSRAVVVSDKIANTKQPKNICIIFAQICLDLYKLLI